MLWVFLAVSSNKHVYTLSSKLHCADIFAWKTWLFSPFLPFLFGPGSDNYGHECQVLSSLTFFSQIWCGDQTCLCRRPVWSSDYSEAGAGQLQPRHHIQGTHWYEAHVNQYFKVTVSVLQYRSSRTLDKELLLISAQWLFKISTCSASHEPRLILPFCTALNIWSK